MASTYQVSRLLRSKAWWCYLSRVSLTRHGLLPTHPNFHAASQPANLIFMSKSWGGGGFRNVILCDIPLPQVQLQSKTRHGRCHQSHVWWENLPSQFFRWIVDTPARGTLGAGCILGDHDSHKTTAVTKAWSRFLVLRKESIQKIASQFAELQNVRQGPFHLILSTHSAARGISFLGGGVSMLWIGSNARYGSMAMLLSRGCLSRGFYAKRGSFKCYGSIAF